MIMASFKSKQAVRTIFLRVTKKIDLNVKNIFLSKAPEAECMLIFARLCVSIIVYVLYLLYILEFLLQNE